MEHRRLISWVLVLLLAEPVNGFGDEVEPGYNLGCGPLQIRSQAVGQSLRLTMPPIDPGKFKTGGYHFHIGTTWTNVWAEEDRYFLDYEMLETNVEISNAFNERFVLALGFTQRNYFGGAMDSSIKWFHDQFSIDQNGRGKAPKNDSRFVFYDDGGNIISNIDDVTHANNNAIYVNTQYLLYRGTTQAPAIGISGMVQYGLETPSSEDDDEPLDIGVAMGFFKRWSERWYSYHQLGYIHYGRTELFGLKFEEDNLFSMNTIEWQWRPKFCFLLQYTYHEAALEDFDELSDASHELDLGFKREFSGGSIIEFALIENIITYDNSPDFGLHLAYGYKF